MKRIFAVLSLTVITLGLSNLSAADPQATLTAKQAKSLLVTATTAQDHQKLATYYRQEADRLDAQAAEHERDAAAYKANPSALEAKMPMAPHTSAHCTYFAAHDRQLAANARVEAQTQALAATR